MSEEENKKQEVTADEVQRLHEAMTASTAMYRRAVKRAMRAGLPAKVCNAEYALSMRAYHAYWEAHDSFFGKEESE